MWHSKCLFEVQARVAHTSPLPISCLEVRHPLHTVMSAYYANGLASQLPLCHFTQHQSLPFFSIDCVGRCHYSPLPLLCHNSTINNRTSQTQCMPLLCSWKMRSHLFDSSESINWHRVEHFIQQLQGTMQVNLERARFRIIPGAAVAKCENFIRLDNRLGFIRAYHNL